MPIAPPGHALCGIHRVASIVSHPAALGFFAGVPYDHPLGNRGFTHSLVFAPLAGALAALAAAALRTLAAGRE